MPDARIIESPLVDAPSVRFFYAPVIRFLRPDGTESRTTTFDRPVFEEWAYVDEFGVSRTYDVPAPAYTFPRSYAYVEVDGEPVAALVRCEVPADAVIDAADFESEVTDPRAMASLVAAVPELAARFTDSPDVLVATDVLRDSPVEVVTR
jgi:hypothetical protein